MKENRKGSGDTNNTVKENANGAREILTLKSKGGESLRRRSY